MLNITDGKIKRPQKVVVYGSEGIGKSTFAAQFPKPLFIDTEGGTSHMNVRRINKPQSWTELINILNEVAETPDICETLSTEEEYIKNMLQIADILLERHQKVIFATTTPLRKEHKKSEKHNANVIRFNSIITPLLEEKGIIINDLHKLVSTDVEKYILPTDNIHLSEAGGEVCAKQVVDVIKTVAKTLCDDARKVKCETSQDKMGVPV